MIIVANARSTDRIASTEARATDGRIAVAGTSCDQIRDRLHHICGVQRYIHSDVDATAGSSVADHDTTGRSIGAITSIRVIEAQIHLPVIGLVFFTWAVNLDFPGLLNIDLRRICHPNDCEHILRQEVVWQTLAARGFHGTRSGTNTLSFRAARSKSAARCSSVTEDVALALGIIVRCTLVAC